MTAARDRRVREAEGVKRTPLPPALAAAPFSVAGSGLSRNRLRAADLDRSIYGMRVNANQPLDLVTRCRTITLRIRDDAIVSHATAAMLWGAPLPPHVEREQAVHVSVPAPESAPHARGIRGHSTTRLPGDVATRSGVAVTSPARTWCDLAVVLDLGDLVAVGDYLVSRRLPLVTIAEIRGRLALMGSGRGIRMARRAVDLVRDASESRPESRLRVILAVAGLPEPTINHTLVDTETGKHLRPDFLFAEAKVILEYQGDYHRSRSQWRKDMTRRSRLEAQGWYVMEINADDLGDPVELVARIRSVLARRTR